MNISIDVQGVRQAIDNFDSLKRGVRNKVLRRANQASAKPAKDSAKKTASFTDRSGLLRRSLIAKTRTYRNTGAAVTVIGADRNVTGYYRGRRRVPANYAHLVELGHKFPGQGLRRQLRLRTNQQGQAPQTTGGMVAGRPFLAPALESNVSSALAIFEAKFKQGVDSEVAKLNA